ncbi:unnamed protein product [Owenia fusiformis]|uniref:long-chain-fatty-acid--CoA ligase n=1 Tax=Owenia fusiformis TaxID=6347 RepID=A0A8J1TXH5_OWEFU|nr:unnamed protein product [Owenia fusiformis]
MGFEMPKSFIFRLARRLRQLVRSLPSFKMSMRLAVYAVTALVLRELGHGWFLTLLGVFTAYLLSGGYKFMRILYYTFPRDARALKVLINAKLKMKSLAKTDGNIVYLFRQTLRKMPYKTCFIFEDKKWTFKDIDEYSNKIANFFYEKGVRQGDVVAIYMESSPDFVCMWLALAKIGAIGALINFNLRMESLAHCIKAANAKMTVYGGELDKAVAEARSLICNDMTLYCLGTYNSDVLQASHLDPLLQQASNMPPPTDHLTKFKDPLFYIYTSGTTGLPKAAIVINSRFFYMSYSLHQMFNMTDDDILYCTLPLYHTAGGVLGVGQALVFGNTVIIKRKFSASKHWDDCIKYNATMIQYIGEIARYLLAQPESPKDKAHKVRLAFGNGLRPQIWEAFMKRFNISVIGEFYGATEGNANVVNSDNKVGAVGFTTMIAPQLYPVTLIRVDEQTGLPLRDENGVCIKCKPGEPGELVGKIIKGDPLREFDGYVNKDASSKKITQNVFAKGDSAFLTGDTLVMDEFGYMYFRDRTGDTFRWRGENVSTAEVEASVSNIVHLKDAVCYGVEIPGNEGRAGMVAIVDEHQSVDLDHLADGLKKSLPAYARPVFVRLIKSVDEHMTGTFKLKKTLLRKEAFNPSEVSDAMFFKDVMSGGSYKPLTKDVYEAICNGTKRV